MIGTFFIALSALGMLRLPDVYSRLHSITKASTLGMAGVLAASAVHFAARGDVPVGELLTMWFVMLTNPVGGHMMARSAYLTGVRLSDASKIDQLDRAGEHRDAEHDMA
jgi:multicomponent Na+:H+ antiporter subunit G